MTQLPKLRPPRPHSSRLCMVWAPPPGGDEAHPADQREEQREDDDLGDVVARHGSAPLLRQLVDDDRADHAERDEGELDPVEGGEPASRGESLLNTNTSSGITMGTSSNQFQILRSERVAGGGSVEAGSCGLSGVKGVLLVVRRAHGRRPDSRNGGRARWCSRARYTSDDHDVISVTARLGWIVPPGGGQVRIYPTGASGDVRRCRCGNLAACEPQPPAGGGAAKAAPVRACSRPGDRPHRRSFSRGAAW